jgi:hypothetical protein
MWGSLISPMVRMLAPRPCRCHSNRGRCHWLSPPVSPPRRPPSIASSGYIGRPPPRERPFSSSAPFAATVPPYCHHWATTNHHPGPPPQFPSPPELLTDAGSFLDALASPFDSSSCRSTACTHRPSASPLPVPLVSLSTPSKPQWSLRRWGLLLGRCPHGYRAPADRILPASRRCR